VRAGSGSMIPRHRSRSSTWNRSFSLVWAALCIGQLCGYVRLTILVAVTVSVTVPFAKSNSAWITIWTA